MVNSDKGMNMTVWNDISEMHQKFGVNKIVAGMTPAQLKEYLKFRLDMCQEELNETRDAENGDDAVDGLIDLIVFAVGTLDAFGVNGDVAWNRVHTKNMQKEAGIKPERPNKFGFPDLIKPEGWEAPSHADNVGLFAKVYD